MAGANIFVIYPSSDGKNVTLSTRQGVGNIQPLHTTAVQAVLLEGSGVSNGIMTANIKCSNCNSWDGGSMDFSKSSTDWIYSVGSGSPFKSDALDATITYHGPSGRSSFVWDLSPAKGGSSVNPFVAVRTNGGNATSGGNATNGDNAPNVTTTSTGSSSGSSPSASFDPEKFDRILLAHGVIAGLVFLGLFPIGGIVIRLFSFAGVIWVHAAIQAIGHLLFIVAFGLGVWMWMTLPLDSLVHPILGSIIFAILIIQPLTGFLHHRLFVRSHANAAAAEKPAGRTAVSWIHIGTGRVAILAGIINGGLGLWLAGVMGAGNIAYAVLAAFMGSLYIVSIVIGERRRSASRRAQQVEARDGTPAGVSNVNANHPGQQPMQQVQPRASAGSGSGSDVDSPTREVHSAKRS
jgi:hypothetical protein